MKKFRAFGVLAFFLAVSAASHGQTITFLADNIKSPTAGAPGGFLAIDVTSMGTSVSCSGCQINSTATSGSGTSVSRGTAGKIVFNINNQVSVNLLKAVLLKGTTSNGNAYFVFSTSGATTKPVTYYYIKLSSYTVLEVDETGNKGDVNTVQVSLGYNALMWTLVPQTSTGIPGLPNTFGWDFTRNIEITGSAIPAGY